VDTLAHWGAGALWNENLLKKVDFEKNHNSMYRKTIEPIHQRNQFVITAFGLIRDLEKKWVNL